VGGAARLGTNPVADASWCHVVMTVELDPAAPDPAAPYTLRYYIDGVLDTEIFNVPIESSTGDWVIGSHKSSTSAFLTGGLDEVSLYATTLDPAAVSAHYAAFLADPNTAPFLGLVTSTDTVSLGDGVDLSWKLSANATTAVLTDSEGNTILADATAVSNTTVFPTQTTTYTFSVNGAPAAEFTIVVLAPILLTDIRFNDFGEVEVSATNLVEGRTYDLFYSEDLQSFFPAFDQVTADASGTAVLVDFFPPEGAQYYRVEEIRP
jgi:hypothetical protein